MTDFRTLCADLLQEFASLYSEMSARVDFNETYTERVDKLLDRTSTALAQPEPVAPSNKKVVELVAWLRDRANSTSLAHTAHRILLAADLLERLSQPEPVAPTDEELEKLADDYMAMDGATGVMCLGHLDFARAALARWGTPANKPGDGEIDEEAATVIPWLLENAARAADADQSYVAGKLTLAAQLLGERRPANNTSQED